MKISRPRLVSSGFIEAAEELFEVIEMILHENDSPDPTTPHSAILPSEWRRPLVKAANKYNNTAKSIFI